jgi:hypothetical protein
LLRKCAQGGTVRDGMMGGVMGDGGGVMGDGGGVMGSGDGVTGDGGGVTDFGRSDISGICDSGGGVSGVSGMGGIVVGDARENLCDNLLRS